MSGHLAAQPQLRRGPFSLHRGRRDPHHVRCLFDGKPPEVAKLHDLALPRIDAGERCQSLVQGEQVCVARLSSPG